MPLPRQTDDGSGGAPVLDILRAHVRLFDVEEHEKPYTVTRKSDGAEFQKDPGFTCTVEVLDDGSDQSDRGVTFFENFRYKNTKKDKSGDWINKENSKLGQLTNVVKPGYFEDESIPDLTAADLEDFELICRLKPRKDPSSGKIRGTTIDWETMQAVPKEPMAVVSETAQEAGKDDDEDIFDDIPF